MYQIDVNIDEIHREYVHKIYLYECDDGFIAQKGADCSNSIDIYQKCSTKILFIWNFGGEQV